MKEIENGELRVENVDIGYFVLNFYCALIVLALRGEMMDLIFEDFE